RSPSAPRDIRPQAVLWPSLRLICGTRDLSKLIRPEEQRGMANSHRADRFAGAVLVLAVACLAIAFGLLGSSAGAANGGQTTVVLGKTGTEPDPSCPDQPCQAVGSVTGFQVSNSQAQLPFNVQRPGKVKSWALSLAQPTNSQRSFFNGFFGTPPEAR